MVDLLFSVIIPVYNTEAYIENCIYSVINNCDNTNTEIIVVDDGSTDRSLELCQAIAKKHSIVKVFHTDNYGVSNARNTGINVSQGEYILFLDSDDWWDQNFLSKVSDYIQSGIELIYFKRYKEYFNEQKIIAKERDICFTSDDDFYKELCQQTKDGLWSNWLCVFKRGIISDNNIRYSLGVKIGEDAEFFYTYCKYVNKAVAIDCGGYVYRVNRDGSAMSTKKTDSVISYGNMILRHITRPISNDNYKERMMLGVLCTNYAYQLKFLCSNRKKRDEHIKLLQKYNFIDFLDKNSRAFKLISVLGMKLYVDIEWRKYVLKGFIKRRILRFAK